MSVSYRLQALLQERHYMLERVRGEDAAGEPVYAFVLVPGGRLQDFRQALASGPVDVTDYGVVVAKGQGEVIPDGLEEAVLAQVMRA